MRKKRGLVMKHKRFVAGIMAFIMTLTIMASVVGAYYPVEEPSEVPVSIARMSWLPPVLPPE